MYPPNVGVGASSVAQNPKPNVLGNFSDAVINAAHSALAQQGWGTILEAMHPQSAANYGPVLPPGPPPHQ